MHIAENLLFVFIKESFHFQLSPDRYRLYHIVFIYEFVNKESLEQKVWKRWNSESDENVSTNDISENINSENVNSSHCSTSLNEWTIYPNINKVIIFSCGKSLAIFNSQQFYLNLRYLIAYNYADFRNCKWFLKKIANLMHLLFRLYLESTISCANPR